MAKAILKEESVSIGVADIKRAGLLNRGVNTGMIITFPDGSSVKILSYIRSELAGYIELSYNHLGRPIKYKIDLTGIKSNLGNGVIWYFECPAVYYYRTRKLYFDSSKSMFVGASSHSGLYESQTINKNERRSHRYWKKMREARAAVKYLESEPKGLRMYYNGKMTKRYAKLVAQRKFYLSQEYV